MVTWVSVLTKLRFHRSMLIAVFVVVAAFMIDPYQRNVFLGFAVAAILSIAYARTSTAVKFTEFVVSFLRRSQLFIPHDVDRETTRINLLRIAAGCLLLHRTYYIFEFLYATGFTVGQLIPIVAIMVAAVMLAVGIVTPVAAGFLLLFNRHWLDAKLGTTTLSSDIMQMILMILIFVPAGTAISLDRRSLPWIYDFVGSPSAERIGLAKLCGMLAYGLLCVYSVGEHFLDQGWVNGYVIAHALTAAATSPHFALIRDFQASHPLAFLRITNGLTYGMMAWELLFIPMVLLSATTRQIAIVWGFLFILGSSLFLTVQWLPSYEFLLWALLFWERFGLNINNDVTMALFYDDRCNLCDRTVRLIRSVDLFNVIKFKPLSLNAEALSLAGVAHKTAMSDLVGVDEKTGRTYAGYTLYIQLTKRLILLMPIWPLLIIARMIWFGPMLYRVIADHRRKWFGTCTRSAVIALSTQDRLGINRPLVGRVFFISFAIIAVVSTLRSPLVRHVANGGLSHWENYAATSMYGITPIDVFNEDTLPIAENFLTITAVSQSGQKTLLPFYGSSGEYLGWQNWSDLAFYGHGLLWRMATINQRPCYDANRDTVLLKTIATYAKRFYPDIDYFEVKYFHEDSITFEQWQSAQPVSYIPSLLCTVELDRQAAIRRLPSSQISDTQP